VRPVVLDPAPAVVAASVLTPLGTDPRALEPRPDPRAHPGTEVPVDLAQATGEPPLRLRRMDRYAALGLAAASGALRGAPAAPAGKGDPEWGLFVGSSLACWSSNARFFLEEERRTPLELSPALFARTVPNAVNGEISIAHRIGGPSQTFVSGWAAGAEALAEAAALLAAGGARYILAGGVEAPDDLLRRMHGALRGDPAQGWLPAQIAEAAAILVLTADAEHAATGPIRIRAFLRCHDPLGALSLARAAQDLPLPPVETLIVANSVASETLERWRLDLPGAERVIVPAATGEIGAAGAPAAAALAAARARAGRTGTVLIVARGVEGATLLLALAP